MKQFLHAIIVLSILIITPSALAEEHIVKVVTDYDSMRMYFSPKTLLIKPGDKVTWVNEEDEDHNMVTYPDGFPKGAKGFQSPYLTKKNERWSHIFDVEGTYEYHCIPHVFMGMHGTVIAGNPSAANDFHVPTPKEMAKYRNELLQFFDEDEFRHAPQYVRMKKKSAKKQ